MSWGANVPAGGDSARGRQRGSCWSGALRDDGAQRDVNGGL